MARETKYRIELTAEELQQLAAYLDADCVHSDDQRLGSVKTKVRAALSRRSELERYMEQFPRSKDAKI